MNSIVNIAREKKRLELLQAEEEMDHQETEPKEAEDEPFDESDAQKEVQEESKDAFTKEGFVKDLQQENTEKFQKQFPYQHVEIIQCVPNPKVDGGMIYVYLVQRQMEHCQPEKVNEPENASMRFAKYILKPTSNDGELYSQKALAEEPDSTNGIVPVDYAKAELLYGNSGRKVKDLAIVEFCKIDKHEGLKIYKSFDVPNPILRKYQKRHSLPRSKDAQELLFTGRDGEVFFFYD